jgi:hypothetical protein
MLSYWGKSLGALATQQSYQRFGLLRSLTVGSYGEFPCKNDYRVHMVSFLAKIITKTHTKNSKCRLYPLS